MNNNGLTDKPIPGLVRKIAIPASIGFFFNTMYNVVDTYYAGFISTQAIAALSVSFPVFFIIIALGSGVSTGATALIANALGEGSKKKATLYSTQAISFGILLSIVLTIIGLIISPPLFRLLGATGNYLTISLQYIYVIFFGTVFFISTYILNAPLQAQGDTKTLRNILVIGFFLNLILDPWFIYGGFGVPAMGIAGVALATVLIQLFSTVYILIKVLKTGILTRECYSQLIPRKQEFIDIAKQGLPAGLNMMTVAVGIFIITFFVSWFGPVAVAAYGIATRIEQIALMPTIGLNIATLTLVGQNNGAKKYDRVKETLRSSIKIGLAIMAIGMIVVFFFARQLMEFFTRDQAVIDIGAPYLRIAVFIFFAYLFLFVNVSALQGVKKPMFALWMGLYRQILGPLVIYWIFATYFGIFGVWYGVFVVTWSAAIISILYTRHVMKHKLYK